MDKSPEGIRTQVTLGRFLCLALAWLLSHQDDDDDGTQGFENRGKSNYPLSSVLAGPAGKSRALWIPHTQGRSGIP